MKLGENLSWVRGKAPNPAPTPLVVQLIPASTDLYRVPLKAPARVTVKVPAVVMGTEPVAFAAIEMGLRVITDVPWVTVAVTPTGVVTVIVPVLVEVKLLTPIAKDDG